MGLPVPRPVGALVQRHGMLLYSGSLLTEFLDGARSLASRIESEACDRIPWEAVGRMIRRFHDEGVMHHDLNASNILLCPSGSYLIDFDKGSFATASTNDSWKQTNLRRLHRSLEKISAGQDRDLGDYWKTLLSAYVEYSIG